MNNCKSDGGLQYKEAKRPLLTAKNSYISRSARPNQKVTLKTREDLLISPISAHGICGSHHIDELCNRQARVQYKSEKYVALLAIFWRLRTEKVVLSGGMLVKALDEG